MRIHHFDWALFFALIALCSIGLLTLSSIAPHLFAQQLVFIILGFCFFIFFTFWDYQIISMMKNYLYLFMIIGFILTYAFGEDIRGSIRWINIGPFALQFSEIFKPFIIILLATVFTAYSKNWQKLLYSLLFLFPLTIIVFKQPDLGNTMIYLTIFLGLLIAGGYYYLIFVGLSFIGLGMPLIWSFLKDYQKNRLLTFLNPGQDPKGAGYNALQAMIAVGNGGLFGRGLGHGTQSHLLFLPEHHTDFIFASFAEEFGFLGVFLLILLYCFLLIRILIVAKNTTDPTARLICLGVFSMLFGQIFINIGMNIGLVPITGITLPLISYGGSSVLSTMISLGIVESIARIQKQKEIFSIK